MFRPAELFDRIDDVCTHAPVILVFNFIQFVVDLRLREIVGLVEQAETDRRQSSNLTVQ